MFDLKFVWVQHKTSDTAPFVSGANRQLATRTEDALANVPRGLIVEGAEYPVMRVFASWPGKVKSHWADEECDGHPLAILHWENFKRIGKNHNQYSFQSGGQRVVVDSKRGREDEAESIASRLQKRRRTVEPAS